MNKIVKKMKFYENLKKKIFIKIAIKNNYNVIYKFESI